MRLVDSHAHLQHIRFADDVAEVIAQAQAAGVERILCPGWDVASSEAAIGMAGRFEVVDASAGVHPHDAGKVDGSGWERITALAAEDRVVAVGETGLDYDRLFSPRELQLANLRRHLALALSVGKPLIIHCRSSRGARDAQDELIAELRSAQMGGATWQERFGGRPPAVLHSYSGPPDYAEAALDLGLAVSISGLAFRRREETTSDVARLVPAERLLVETDSPYLPPPGANPRRNEPQWVAITAAWVADLRGEDQAELGSRLVSTYDRLFRRA